MRSNLNVCATWPRPHQRPWLGIGTRRQCTWESAHLLLRNRQQLLRASDSALAPAMLLHRGPGFLQSLAPELIHALVQDNLARRVHDGHQLLATLLNTLQRRLGDQLQVRASPVEPMIVGPTAWREVATQVEPVCTISMREPKSDMVSCSPMPM